MQFVDDNNSELLMVFQSPKMLFVLERSFRLYLDGTFSTVPAPFYQVSLNWNFYHELSSYSSALHMSSIPSIFATCARDLKLCIHLGEGGQLEHSSQTISAFGFVLKKNIL